MLELYEETHGACLMKIMLYKGKSCSSLRVFLYNLLRATCRESLVNIVRSQFHEEQHMKIHFVPELKAIFVFEKKIMLCTWVENASYLDKVMPFSGVT
jgi:hypothetical protein